VTYSIVARDGETGDLGVAVQTRAFSVGRTVPWALPGVGAVATQAFSERSYGPLGLELLQAGRTPEQTLRALVAADEQAEARQVGIVDAAGRAAAHTGEACIPECGHTVGDGFAVQANMMRSAEVWPAMAEAYTSAGRGDGDGDGEVTLARRLLDALDAAEAAGGDFRGGQSAAILVVAGERSSAPWDGRISDLRVDDHAEPLAELRRLLDLEEAYGRLNRVRGEVPEEEANRARAAGVAEDNLEWFAVAAAWRAGDLDEARRRLARLLARDPRWEASWHVLASTPPPEPQ
jgi:uncharacterized Ntn-hydrolase superfamily protein